MTDSPPDAAAVEAVEKLLAYYNFQDAAQTREQLLDSWLRAHPLPWVRLALIEALYQGRYKSVSVEYLLQLWQRRGQPVYHFSREFERLVCHNCPRTFLSLLEAPTAPEKDPQSFLQSVVDSLRASPAVPATEEASPRFASNLDPALLELLADEAPSSPDLREDVKGLDDADNTNATAVAEEANRYPDPSTDEFRTTRATPSTPTWPHQAFGTTTQPRAVSSSATPIHRFTPSSRPSELFTKLAAMANAQG